jgi:hypothetical protein
MYDEVLPKKLRDKILRDLKAKPAKSVKHGDHDQADHGRWATNYGVTPEPMDKQSAYRFWKKTGNEWVQNHLRGELKIGKGQKWVVEKMLGAISEIDADMNSRPAFDEGKLLYRGISANTMADELKGLKVGDVFHEPGYSATAENKRQAEVFAEADMSIAKEYRGALLEITLGPGIHGIDFQAEGYEPYYPEKETLLQRDLAFEVTGIVKGGTWGEVVDKIQVTAYPLPTPKVAKSIKHGDHDQSEHGSWATGGGNAFGYTAGKLPLSDNNQSPAANEVLMRARELQAEGRGEPVADPTEDDQYGGESTYGKSEELLREVGFAVPGADTFIKGWTASVEDSTRYREEAEILARGGDASGVSRDTLAGLHLVEASAPTEETMYRGLSMSSEDLARYQVGSEVPLSFAAFTTARGESEQFASATQDKQAVQLVLESGAKAIPMVGFDPNSVIGEHVTSGWFEVVNVGTTRVTNGFGPTNEITQVTIRHTGTFDLGSPVKSLKHGDHDQSDHGAWAHGGNLERNPPLSGASRSEADKTLSAMYNKNDLNGPLADKLEMTDLQVYAAQHYRSTGYMEINNLLRGDGSDWGREFSPADIRAIELLDETMQKSTLDEFTTVYRGTHMMAGEASTFLDGLKVGEVYTDPTFVSTTRDEDVARDFALNRAPDDAAENRTSIIWELVSPSGTSAIDIEKLFPGYGSHEREVLLGRDTHFRILGKEDGGYGPSGEPVIRIKATVIPTAVKSLKHGDHDQSEHGSWATGGGGNALSEHLTDRSKARFEAAAEKGFAEASRQWSLDKQAAEKLGLTRMEIAAAMAYSANGALDVNRTLRMSPEDKDDMQFWKEYDLGMQANISLYMDQAISRSGLPAETTLYRGMAFSTEEEVAFIKAGSVYTDPGYGSTSGDSNIASTFSMNPDNPNGVGVLWKITAPEGYPSLAVSGILQSDEQETILARGAQYRIDKVSTTGPEENDGMTVVLVRATLLPVRP